MKNLLFRIIGPSNFSLKEKLLFFLILIFFITNFNYVSYPDEFVNLLAGQAIRQGHLPYVDFFDHHMPGAWYLASILLSLSFGSYVIFRLLFALFTFGILFAIALFIKRKFQDLYPFYLGFFLMYPLLAVYFWFHLFLGDSLAVLFFSAAFWLILAQTLTRKIDFRITIISSLFTFACIFSSLTYLYLGVVLYLWQIYLLWPDKKRILKLVAWIFTPYLIYLLFLFLTKSFADFYFSNFTYNTQIYISIPNYVRGRFFNPLKFALTLIFNFYTNYLPLLSKIKHLDLYLPVGVLASISTLLLLILLASRNLVLAGLFFFVLSFSAPRSNVDKITETDYQAALFIILGAISSFIVLYLFKNLRFKEQLIEDLKRVSQAVVAILLLFSFIFLFANTYNKYFQRYTQVMPSIRSREAASDFLNEILSRGDFFWVGPYDPHEAFFVKNGKLPGKYPTLLPQFKENEYLKSTFIEQFEKNPPKIIIFKQEASIFMTPATQFGDFFLEWMRGKYTQVSSISGIKVQKSPSGFNLQTDLYLLNSEKDKLLQTLRSKSYIE